MPKDLCKGMPTLIEFPEIQGCVSLCKKFGLDFIELNMNLPQYQIENIDTDFYKGLIAENEIFFTLHLDENLNICDFNQRVAKAYLDTVMSAIDLAKRLQIPILNMHLPEGVYFTMPDRRVYLFKEYEDRYLKKITEFRDVCAKKIGKEDICICIENCGEYKDFHTKAITLLLEKECFALTWDIGHDHASGNKDGQFLMSNINKIKHFHIHDAEGEKNHLPLGEGEIDIAGKIKIAKKLNCRCVLETKTAEGLEKSANYLKAHGY